MLLTYNTERLLFKPVATSSSSTRPSIHDLPAELSIEILRYLHYRDILRCQSVCRFLRDVVNSCQELRYIIELAADNLVDGSRTPGSPSTGERLQLLLDRRRRWRQLDWTKKEVVPLPGKCQAYEFVGGTFSKSMSSAPADPWGSSPASKHLNVTWLPGREAQHTAVIREDLGVPMKDFAIDPSQDLIALVEMDEHHITSVKIKVHLRTISTNAKHPSAAKACLSAPIPFQVGTCFIQIVHDVVGMFFWLHGPGLIVWNWRTGEMLVLRTGFDLPPGTWDFAFLSPRAFLLTSTDGCGAIELFTFRSRAAGAADVAAPRHVASLRLPELVAGRDVRNFSTHGAPFLGGDVTRGVPFAAAQDDRIHVMSLTYGDRSPRFHLFLKNSFLLGLATGEEDARAKRVLAWEQWGPDNTRFFEHNVQFQWLRYVHGHRVVLPPVALESEDPEDTSSVMFVMDFQVHPKRTRDPCDDVPHADPAHTWGYQVNADASQVAVPTLFTRTVTSRLPYAISHRIGDFGYTGFMLDDARIVGLKDSAFSEGEFNDIDVFTM
ncbi:hypothetical protein PHLGIDRAFT_413636 [Phlebiopsis gigantea 11061_1 CR5-6]|uniref:F-box domain-containing protein n=1 Tax=Phlebiopsis gigantea (strain 11061_1 CR5-6) TaxID=745531 RepID=A0A0C3NR00_PHLG1|nr:hypothetical protein PHLGIDRAFT_413636 [Phlebiopsis gigantea 11061_1 CR5-6]